MGENSIKETMVEMELPAGLMSGMENTGGDRMAKRLGLILIILISLAVIPVWAEDGAIGRLFTEKPVTSLDAGWIPESLKVSPDSNMIGYILKEQGSEIAVINGIRNRKYQDIQDDMLYFSPNSQHVAYIAQQGPSCCLVLDGIEQRNYQEIKKKSLIFSEDGKHLAYIAKVNNKWLAVHDVIEGPLFDDIGVSTLKLSFDGTHLFYGSQKDGQWFLISDGKVGQAYDGIRSVVCDPAGKRVAAVVRIESRFAVVVDQKLSQPYEMIRPSSLKFNADGNRLAYIAHLQGKQMVVINDIAGKEYEQIGTGGIVFSTDGSHFGYTAKNGDAWTMVVDGHESPWYHGIMESGPLFSPNGKKFAYAAKIGGQWAVVLNGIAGPRYDAIGNDTLTFSPDSRRFAYVAKKKDKWLVSADGDEGRFYDDIGCESLTFSPGGRHLVYSARRGQSWFVVLNGTEGRAYPNIITGLGGGITFEGVGGFKYQALKGFSIVNVDERLLEKESVKEYTFRFNPPTGTRFVVNQRLNGMMKMDKLAEENFLFEQNIKSEYLINKTNGGFEIKVRFINLVEKINGEDVHLDLGSFLKDTFLTIITNPQGRFLRIEGVDNFYQKLEANIPKNILKSHEELFSKKSLEENVKNQWEESVGRLVGKSFRLGDIWTLEDKVMLPGQDYLNCTSTIKFTDEVRQNNRDWVRMKVEGAFDNKAIEKFMNEMGKTAASNINLNAKFDMNLTGESVVDPQTMLQLGSEMTLAMKMAVDTPQGRLNATLKMQMTTDIEYL